MTVLAAFALAGCNQNTTDNSSNAPSTNSSMADTNGMGGAASTNVPAINSLPGMNTNLPATNTLHDMETNMPASTNQ